MKAALAFLMALGCLAGPALQAVAEEPAASAAATPAEAVPFTLIISGTRHYQDAEVIRGNIARSPAVQRLVPTVSSQNHLQFSGAFRGDPEGFVADIQGLASDRFEVGSREDPARGLIITLRKMQAE